MTPTAADRSLNSPHSSKLSTPSSVTLRRGARIDATARRAMNNHNRHSAREKPQLGWRQVGQRKGQRRNQPRIRAQRPSPVRSCSWIYLVYTRTVHLRSKITARSPDQQRARILRSPASLLLLSPCLVPLAVRSLQETRDMTCCDPACALLSSSIHSCRCGVARSPTMGSQEGSPCSGVSELITGTESLSTPERVAAATVRRDRSLNPDTCLAQQEPALQKEPRIERHSTRDRSGWKAHATLDPALVLYAGKQPGALYSCFLAVSSRRREWRPRISRKSAGCDNTAVLSLKGSLRARLRVHY